MSELIQTHDNHATIRWKLLTGASALALTAYVASTGLAGAEDSDRPTVWIELGGQMEAMQGLSSPFTPPFTLLTPTPGPYKGESPISAQRPPRFAFGLDGKISFQPEDSNWIFSAGIRYGRSHAKRHVHHQTTIGTFIHSGCFAPPYSSYCYTGVVVGIGSASLADTRVLHSEKHAILDFSAGKDVGLGLLGLHGTSNVNAGVRFAQFAIKSKVDVYARPTVNITYPTRFQFNPYNSFHQYTMHAHAARSFKGVGPSLSWNGSAVMAGNARTAELTLDLGINAAILFGRQKAKTDHSTHATQLTHTAYVQLHFTPLYGTPSHHRTSTRSRSVSVPNVGGYAGLSLKWTNAKISFGYRYDTFLNAMDTGIDVAKKSNLTFNGPYASISVGLGD